MPFRRLPDGSMLDTDTGNFIPGDHSREAAARMTAESRGYRAPVKNKGQPQPQLSKAGTMAPVNSLAISPYSAMGEDATPAPAPAAPAGVKTMSDGTKRLLVLGAVLAGAYGLVCLQDMMKGKKK